MNPLLELLLTSKKAIVAAILTLVVVGLRVYWPDVATTEVQESLRVLLELFIVGAGVWYTSNHKGSDDEK